MLVLTLTASQSILSLLEARSDRLYSEGILLESSVFSTPVRRRSDNIEIVRRDWHPDLISVLALEQIVGQEQRAWFRQN